MALLYSKQSGGSGSGPDIESLVVAVSDEATDLATGTGVVTFRMPFTMLLSAIRASVNTAPTGGEIEIDILDDTVSVFDVGANDKLTIDATSKTSVGSAKPASILNPTITDNSEVTIDINSVGATATGKGLKITFNGTRI